MWKDTTTSEDVKKGNKSNDQLILFIAAAASEPEASEQDSSPNFVLWVEIKIFYLAHCMTVPVF
jgi:hypothetical protein